MGERWDEPGVRFVNELDCAAGQLILVRAPRPAKGAHRGQSRSESATKSG
jgi:hypothetical protein